MMQHHAAVCFISQSAERSIPRKTTKLLMIVRQKFKIIKVLRSFIHSRRCADDQNSIHLTSLEPARKNDFLPNSDLPR